MLEIGSVVNTSVKDYHVLLNDIKHVSKTVLVNFKASIFLTSNKGCNKWLSETHQDAKLVCFKLSGGEVSYMTVM